MQPLTDRSMATGSQKRVPLRQTQGDEKLAKVFVNLRGVKIVAFEDEMHTAITLKGQVLTLHVDSLHLSPRFVSSQVRVHCKVSYFP